MRIVIDGSRFSDIGGFYDEMEHILTKDLSWRTGRNMDAFHDLLRGGFGVFEYGESVDFFWIHSEKSRQEFGFDATARYWEDILTRCHPVNRPAVREKAENAKRHSGPTLFDLIVGEILCRTGVYSHTLTLGGEPVQ